VAVIWTKEKISKLTYDINGACINVHKHLGPGLLESVYHKCLKIEFDFLGISYLSELPINTIYREQKVDLDFRCDFLIEGQIILELKAVREIEPIFEAQVLTYMQLLKVPKGILMNFNVRNLINDGYQPFVNSFYSDLPDE
jgi:GxxExxY protein